jgi:hypothetical protein
MVPMGMVQNRLTIAIAQNDDRRVILSRRRRIPEIIDASEPAQVEKTRRTSGIPRWRSE